MKFMNISNNTTKLNELLEIANDLPELNSSADNSPQYCNLTIQVGSNTCLAQIVAKTSTGYFEDGWIINSEFTSPVTIENIQCNSMFTLDTWEEGKYEHSKINVSGDMSVIEFYSDRAGRLTNFFIKGKQGGNYTMTIDWIEDFLPHE